MLASLLILILTCAMCGVLGTRGQWVRLARWPAVLGAGAALGVSLAREWLLSAPAAGVIVPWPGWLLWLGQPVYRSDTLSAGLGAWCLLLGLLYLLKVGVGESRGNPAFQLANALAILATLYSLVHTDNLLAYAGQLFLLSALVLASQTWAVAEAGDYSRSMAGLLLSAALMLGAALLVGRTMGGAYSLSGMSLSVLSVWPLLLVGGFVLLWLGIPPVTGWSARLAGGDRATVALVQSLAIGVPVFLLLLRLQGLVSGEALAGTVPQGWSGFMGVLAWFGGVGALVTAAGLLVWAGSARWTGLLTSYTMALGLCALCQDDPTGRVAALALLGAYGAARATLELSRDGVVALQGPASAAAIASLALAPLTPGFIGLWLLAGEMSGAKHPGIAIVLLGAAVLAACGVALHYAGTSSGRGTVAWHPALAWLGVAAGAGLLVAGAIPGLWLPIIERMSRVGGGDAPVGLPWQGLTASGLALPLLLLALVAGLLWAGGRLLSAWARSSASGAGVLLPTAVSRLQDLEDGPTRAETPAWEGAARTLLANPPSAVWWLSLSWLESGVWGFGTLLGRLGTRFGGLMARLEGRFYLPLALILILIVLLVTTR